jgi:hypothetical protein
MFDRCTFVHVQTAHGVFDFVSQGVIQASTMLILGVRVFVYPGLVQQHAGQSASIPVTPAALPDVVPYSILRQQRKSPTRNIGALGSA